jgi:PKD repeat protein
VFANPGTHIVTLTVTDSKGQSDQAIQAIRVTSTNQLPSAAFIWGATDPKTRALVSFDASASTDVDGQVATYAWNFGDGSTGNGIVRDHRYTAPGTYPVTLTVTDNAGLKVSFCQAVKTGSFSGGPVLACH